VWSGLYKKVIIRVVMRVFHGKVKSGQLFRTIIVGSEAEFMNIRIQFR
jgi:hypothetical protein